MGVVTFEQALRTRGRRPDDYVQRLGSWNWNPESLDRVTIVRPFKVVAEDHDVVTMMHAGAMGEIVNDVKYNVDRGQLSLVYTKLSAGFYGAPIGREIPAVIANQQMIAADDAGVRVEVNRGEAIVRTTDGYTAEYCILSPLQFIVSG